MKIYFPHNVIIERATETQDSVGQVKQTFSTHATRRCRINPVKVDPTVNGPEMMTIGTHEIEMHYFNIRETDRLKYGSRIFNIVEAINVNEEGRYTRLLVKEVK